MSDQNWRTDVNAQDYFGHQKKQMEVESRRPVIRKPSDLVGPGIAANAVRITDFNDHLATYDGFFAADVGALNAPNGEALAGTVTSDDALGGVQTFTGLTSGATFQRVFNRNPSDAATIYWGDWIVLSDGTGGDTFLETLPVSIIDAKGDIIVGVSDNVATVKAVGADGYSLVADSTATGGVSWDTRIRSIIPDGDVTVDDSDPFNPIISVVGGLSTVWEDADRHTVVYPGAQVFVLSHEPVEKSLFVRWHPLGMEEAGLVWPSEHWTLVDNLVTLLDPDSVFEADDALSAQYEYNLGDSGMTEVGTFDVESRTSGTQHSGVTLVDGGLYTLSVEGTFNIYGEAPAHGTSVPMLHPSPGGPGVVAMADAEWAYGDKTNPGPFPLAGGSALEYNLGAGWVAWGTATAAPRSDRTYTKEVTGGGTELLLRFVDGAYSDNDGILRVTIEQE